MKEYVVQFWTDFGDRWITPLEFVKHPCETEHEARQLLAERQLEKPWNKYRIVSRTVTEWEEVN